MSHSPQTRPFSQMANMPCAAILHIGKPHWCTNHTHAHTHTHSRSATAREADSYSSMTLDSDLIQNAADGNLEKVLDLLRRGANVNAKDKNGWTALIHASFKGHLEVARILLNHEGVDVNIKSQRGWTALIWASSQGHVEVVRALLNHNGDDVNATDNKGVTALILASEYGHPEVVRALLKHDGLDVNIQDNFGRTALMLASSQMEVIPDVDWMECFRMQAQGRLQVVRALLNHDGVDVNINNNFGYTALALASMYGKSEVVRALLEHESVDVNFQDTIGNTSWQAVKAMWKWFALC